METPNPNPDGNPDGNPNPNPVISSPIEHVTSTAVMQPGQTSTTQQLPLWIEAAIRLGVRFLRVAAAGEPPALTRFAPRHAESETDVYCECGKRHPAIVDEYYFWLLDSRYFDDPNNPNLAITQDVTPAQDATWNWETLEWRDNNGNPDLNAMPALLLWDSKPMVQLSWCRVHNGEFQQPRRSVEGVPVDGSSTPELQLQGRTDDSLTFHVAGSILPAGYPHPASPPPPPVIGFRYDLATDEAITLPLVIPAPPTGAKNPGGLPAYPFFV